MIHLRSMLEVADNTGARIVRCIGVIHRSEKKYADIGDVVSGSVREATPDSLIKKGEKVKAVIVRTRNAIRRRDGSTLKFDGNACVLIDEAGNPRGSRIFGPVARELREKRFAKIVSLAPEVI
ncbi:MAG: 50S ribosomal protein L14 [Candidatus Omnitrophota bacterium]|nr:MAG: 50S ribosomal protein L14 [Candidatus Omnitrophota bacterium]